ncbi:type 1 glutamine amidotransferase [Planctomycetales bacterium ZRK34]|nr:type 1 glutamine amidotransferase [Planctomycetales bacterium ZRK34]
MLLRIHWFQHEPFEGPAAIAEWAAQRGHTMTGHHLYRGDAMPSHDEVDMLVLMGGGMSVNDTDTLNWLTPELVFVAQTIAAGKPVFGVCLGAQLIAKSLGARVYPGKEKEIGWFETRRVAGDVFPETFTPLHWHGETFDLPDGAERLAETDEYPNQALRIGPCVIGVQFHLESNVESVAAICQGAGSDITGGPWQQSLDEILADQSHFGADHKILFYLLDTITRD